MLGLVPSCAEWGLLSSCRVQASHCSGFSCCRTQALCCVGFCGCRSCSLEHRLSSCGSWALLSQGVWNFPRAATEPVSPALTGGFFTTEPPGRPLHTGFHLQVLFYQAQDPSLPEGAIHPRPAAYLRAEPKAVHINRHPRRAWWLSWGLL